MGCEAVRTMYPGASQETTAREYLVCQHQGGLGARLDGKVNSGEPMVNLVRRNRLKVLTSLNQKVRGWLFPFHMGTHGQESRRGIVGTYAIASTTRNTVSPYHCHVSGKPTVRKAGGGAGRRCWSKRRPFCNGADRAADAERPNSKGCRLPAGLS